MITLEARRGEFILHAMERAMKMAQVVHVPVELVFNDVVLTVQPESTLEELLTAWNTGKVRPL